MSIRIGVTTDVHHSAADVGTKVCTKAIEYLTAAVAIFNAKATDIVVDCGDAIEDVDLSSDQAFAADLKAVFDGLECDHEHVVGNHDVANMSIEQWEAIFGGGSFTSHSRDLLGFHLVFWSPDVDMATRPYTYSAGELEWLEDDLGSTSLPAIVFTHVPIHASSLKGNGYFEDGDGNGEFVNGDDARAILAASTAVLVVNGHTHWNSWHVEDDIYYVTIPSLTEQRRTMPFASASFAIIDVDDDHIAIKVRGRDSVAYKLRRRQGEATWS